MVKEMEKISWEYLKDKKIFGVEGKTSWVVVYTIEDAFAAQEAGIEIGLIGDSKLMNLWGFPDTSEKTAAALRDIGIDIMDLMVLASHAVRKVAPNMLLIGDLPVNTYRNILEAVHNAKRFSDQAKMDAVKLEVPMGYGEEMVPQIRAIADEGIPVVVHEGTTPQTANGDFKTQGRTAESAELLIRDALFAQEAGASMILLENVAEEVGTLITNMLHIPVASLGAGRFCDIVLVLGTDAVNKLGKFAAVHPYFVKQFANVSGEMLRGFQEYQTEVKLGKYPGKEHCRSMYSGEHDKLVSILKKQSIL
jgi:3-methyl-2-oxobutanoate hydroxymethyltransferase